MNKTKIAKELIKLAKSLVAVQLIGDSYYRIIDEQEKEISINFNIDTTDRDKFMGWMDAMLGRPTEILKIAEKYGFEDMPDTMDTVGNFPKNCYFSICLKGNEQSDMEGLIEELKSLYHCKEVK